MCNGNLYSISVVMGSCATCVDKMSTNHEDGLMDATWFFAL